jgi:hypothetical protein
MNDIFILNPDATELDIKDAIDERITKAKAIGTKLLTNIQDKEILDPELLRSVIWTINDFLEEIDFLYQKIAK